MRDTVNTAFYLQFDNNIMAYILTSTAMEEQRILETEWSLPRDELEAFICCYMHALHVSKKVNVSFLWTSLGPAFFSNAISQNYFIEMFDVDILLIKTCEVKIWVWIIFALISNVQNSYIENNQNCYKPAPNITQDEQILPSNARCGFIQYMSNKLDRFCITYWWKSDAKNKYVVKVYLY